MTQRTEERLRDAIHKYTETIEPAADGWVRIREHTITRRRRLRWPSVITAAAVAAVLAIIVAVAIVRSDDRAGIRVQTPPKGSTSAPSEIVASIEDGRVIVLDTRTGAEVRALAEGADAKTTIAVTPDAQRVFFDRPSRPGSDPPREIVTVATTGGEARRLIGGAGEPAISPDGRLLAFVRYSPRTGSGQPNGLEVVELPNTFERWTPNVVGDGTVDEADQRISGLSWAPDSRHLVYTLFSSPQGSYPRVAESTIGMRLDQAPIVPINDGSDVAGYLGDTGKMLGRTCVASNEPDQRLRVIVIDPQSGQESRQLFRYPSLCGSERLSSDRSGRHILAQGPAGLYRWSEGDEKPTKVANGVTSAAWAPASAAAQNSTAAPACGSELPRPVPIPPGYSGPHASAIRDAPTTASSTQLVQSWTAATGDIEVRWSADPALAASFPPQPPASSPIPYGAVTPTQVQQSSSGRFFNYVVFQLSDQRPECQTLQVSVFDTDSATVAAVINQIRLTPFASNLPLIAGSQSVDAAPNVVPCQTPPGVSSPNRGGPITGADSHPTPAAALQGFVEADPTLPKNSYQELRLPDGSIAYGWQNPAGDWVIVVNVTPTGGSWIVDNWDASGC